MKKEYDFTDENFKLATSFIEYTHEHVFLTGKAGTGKTTFLKYIKDRSFKNYILTAPTGVAAINAGGVTLHSFFHLPFGTFIADYHKNWQSDQDAFIINKRQLLSKLRLPGTKRKIINELELLIIDEVSMVRADVLDAVDTVLRHIRKRNNEPFGGVQMLFIGDLYQLPPVIRQHELMVMYEYYNSPFFFDAQALQDNQPVCIELNKVYRQDDEKFINLLNNIRQNNVDEFDFQLLENRYDPYFIPQPHDNIITLTSHNVQADAINERELHKLHTTAVTLDADIRGDFPESLYPIDKQLTLKEGAQVMFIKNDKGESRRFYNGKIGKVHKIDFEDQEIEVYLPEDDKYISIAKDLWENNKYELDETDNTITQKSIGKFEQFPLKLAWAVTIHKSQGLTFHQAVIDAGRSFAAGQVYVALSRLTDIKGMILRSRITSENIKVDERIIRYMRHVKSPDQLKVQLEMGRKAFILDVLKSGFLWQDIILKIADYLSHNLSEKSNQKLTSDARYNKIFSAFGKLDKVGLRFILQIEQLFNKQSYEKLKERVNAASIWMLPKLKSEILEVTERWMRQVKVQKNGAVYARALQYILLQVHHKMKSINRIKSLVNTLSVTSNTEEALESYHKYIPESDNTIEKVEKQTPKKGASRQITFDLFEEGKGITEIMQLRNLKRTTIMQHLSSFVKTGHLDPNDLMPSENILIILDMMKKYPNYTVKEIKHELQQKYDYQEILFVFAYKQFLESEERI